MDKAILAAKVAKIAPAIKPLATPSVPAPVQEVKAIRGTSTGVEAPEGAVGVQPTLMEKSNAEDLIPTDPWETSPMFYEIANFLNIEPKFFNAEKDKVSMITDWAIQQADSNKLEDIYHVIRTLQDGLNHMDMFEKPHNVLYRYLRLRAHADAANKAVHAFEKVKETY